MAKKPRNRPATRKTMTMLVTVSVPREMTAIQAKREIRTLISHQSNWSSQWDLGDVKVRRCKLDRGIVR